MSPINDKSREDIEIALSETNDEATQIDRIAEIRGWFRPEENSIFYPALKEYLSGSADLRTTVTRITSPIDEAISANNIKNFNPIDLWYSIFHSAKRVSYRDVDEHTKLIDLLEAFRKHVEPASTSERSSYDMLSDLPMAAREVLNDSPHPDRGVFTAEVHAWTNFNYFLARMINAALFDQYHWAIWAMRKALEERPEPLQGWFDAHVPAAAVWVFGIGKKLYEKEEDLTPKNRNQGNPAKGGDLWSGGTVFSKERWAFWKRRFAEVMVEEVSEETKEVAKEAIDAMEKIENS